MVQAPASNEEYAFALDVGEDGARQPQSCAPQRERTRRKDETGGLGGIKGRGRKFGFISASKAVHVLQNGD